MLSSGSECLVPAGPRGTLAPGHRHGAAWHLGTWHRGTRYPSTRHLGTRHQHPAPSTSAPSTRLCLLFSPRRKSEATQMASRPCWRISLASESRSVEPRDAASLISIGRLTPVITSRRSFSRNVMPRFDGVPPNMSVNSRTPSGPRTRSIACRISSRASLASSCHPIETAVNCGRSPTIISAAFTNSVAS